MVARYHAGRASSSGSKLFSYQCTSATRRSGGQAGGAKWKGSAMTTCSRLTTYVVKKRFTAKNATSATSSGRRASGMGWRMLAAYALADAAGEARWGRRSSALSPSLHPDAPEAARPAVSCAPMSAEPRLRIAYVLDVYDGVKTGGVISARRFVAALRRHHDVTVLTSGPADEGRVALPSFYPPFFARVMREMGFAFAVPRRPVLERVFRGVD